MKNKFKAKSEFRYWFLRKGITSDFAVIDTMDESYVADLIMGVDVRPKSTELSADMFEEMRSKIQADYTEFIKRPEFIIGTKIPDELLTDTPIDKERRDKMKSYCDMFIRGCCHKLYDESVASKYAERSIKWLNSTDFYDAPASTRYHDSEPSGLLRHTLKVVNRTIDLTTIDPFKSIDLAEAIIVAIVHDFCKINFYESFMRNVKDDTTGEWSKVASYRHKPSDYPFGHGVTSLYMAEKLFKFTLEQALAIRWHMSVYDVSDYEKSDLFDANEKYPMVTLIQMADQLSIL